MALEELLNRDQGITVHCKNIIKIFKTFSGENPYFMKNTFMKKMQDTAKERQTCYPNMKSPTRSCEKCNINESFQK